MANSASPTTLKFETNEGTLEWALDEHTSRHFQQLVAKIGYEKAYAMLIDAVKPMTATIAIDLCLKMSPHLQASRNVSD